MSIQTNSTYHAYLIRFWRDDHSKPWRVTLEDPHTGLKYGFATLEKLFSFLSEQADAEKLSSKGIDP